MAVGKGQALRGACGDNLLDVERTETLRLTSYVMLDLIQLNARLLKTCPAPSL